MVSWMQLAGSKTVWEWHDFTFWLARPFAILSSINSWLICTPKLWLPKAAWGALPLWMSYGRRCRVRLFSYNCQELSGSPTWSRIKLGCNSWGVGWSQSTIGFSSSYEQCTPWFLLHWGWSKDLLCVAFPPISQMILIIHLRYIPRLLFSSE